MLSKKKGMPLLIGTVAEMLAQDVREKVPEDGTFPKCAVRFRYPHSQMRGLLFVEPDLVQDGRRRLTAAACFLHDARMVSNYLFVGSNAEILDYLLSEAKLDEMVERFTHLQEKLQNMD